MNKRKGFYCDMNRDDFIAWKRRLTGHASRDTAATEPIDYARKSTDDAIEALIKRQRRIYLYEAIAVTLLSGIALYALTW